MTEIPSSATPQPQRPVVPLWLVAMVVFSGTLAVHIFVPTLQVVATDLGTSAVAAQLTIGVYILGLALGQLVIGPISDRYGRRPVLMAGLLLYALASIAATFATDINTLVAARFVQALGGCAGLVLGRAIIRDGGTMAEAARRLAGLNLIVLIGPGFAPLIGGAFASIVGWRWIFAALSVLGFGLLLLTWRRLEETADLSKAQSGRTIMRNYLKLLVTPVFLGLSIGGAFATTSFYGFTAAAPFIFVHQLNRSPHEVGLYISVTTFGAWLGTLAATRLVRVMSVRQLMLKSSLICLAASIAFFAFTVTGQLSLPAIIATMMIYAMGCGMAGPASLAEAISIDPRIVGSAAGVYGFFQMLAGALCSTLTGLGSDPSLAVAIVLVGAALITQVSYFIAMRVEPAVRD